MRAPRVRRSFLACFAFQGFSGLAFGSAVCVFGIGEGLGGCDEYHLVANTIDVSNESGFSFNSLYLFLCCRLGSFALASPKLTRKLVEFLVAASGL
jgi:hypothetical protein